MWANILIVCILKLTLYVSTASPKSMLQVKGMSVTIEPKIINGTIALPEKNKHQASIHLKSSDMFFGAGHICGGALIKPSVVITAAHCLYNYDLKILREPSELIVSMGSMATFDRTGSTTFEVLELRYKKTFNITTYVDDIALMILNGAVQASQKNIKPIDIKWGVVVSVGTICQVAGWGVTEAGFTSDVLMSLDVPIVNHTVCVTNYEGLVSDGMICAGYMNGEADSCEGDSGGPLVCNGTLTGIVSFGVGCALKNFPGVYTDVNFHSEWIRNMTSGMGKAYPFGVCILICLMFFQLF